MLYMTYLQTYIHKYKYGEIKNTIIISNDTNDTNDTNNY